MCHGALPWRKDAAPIGRKGDTSCNNGDNRGNVNASKMLKRSLDHSYRPSTTVP